jgi:hypothetical protein
MFLQKFQIFVLERFLLVVGALVFDVIDHRCQSRAADGKSAVAFLPGEIGQMWEGVMDPFGGIALDILRNLAGRQRWWHYDQGMNMVVISANL